MTGNCKAVVFSKNKILKTFHLLNILLIDSVIICNLEYKISLFHQCSNFLSKEPSAQTYKQYQKYDYTLECIV